MEKQIKSKKRVSDHGEVFTAEREVKAMCDLVSNECLRVDSRFLEPACGDGNFLAEILERKLEVVTNKYKKVPYDWEINSIIALGSLYGVELLADNVIACKKRLYAVWEKAYKKAIRKGLRNDDVCQSALHILDKNIIRGNALSLMQVDENCNDTDKPIVFSQWACVMGPLIQRKDYTFSQLLNDENLDEKQAELQIDENKDGEGTLIEEFPPVHYRRLG